MTRRHRTITRKKAKRARTGHRRSAGSRRAVRPAGDDATSAPRRSAARPGFGSIFVISAPSGAGKTTLCKRLLAEIPDIRFSVSFTTRAPRRGEREGVDYHFVERDEFLRRREEGEFLEWAEVDGQLYGTSAAQVRDAAASGQDVVLDIDSQGAASVRRLLPTAVHIFILPPGPEALRSRLAGRGTEPPEALERRLRLARGELAQARLYDYVVLNDDLDAAYDRLRAIVVAARCRRERQDEAIASILANYGDGA